MHNNSLNPYPGLRPFRTDEEYLFFGRDEQCQDLIRLLGKRRFIGVLGSSGTGKSSLVRAGLLPALYRGGISEAGSHWSVAICRPGGDPVKNLAEALLDSDLWDHLEEEHPVPDRLEIETILQRSGKGLSEVVKIAQVPEKENLLVVVDQFEELFRFHQRTSGMTQRETAEAFVNLLLEGAQDDHFAIHIVLTMRSDFFGDCAAFAGLSEVINQGSYLVPRLTRAQLKEAIEGPCRVGGAEIAPRLVQRLLNDVGGDPDELPVLQHALMRTFDRWRERDVPNEELDLYHYEDIGGMEEALSRHADEIYQSLDQGDQLLVERLFKALTEKTSDDRGIRRPMSLERLSGIVQADSSKVSGVIGAFRSPGVTFLMPAPEVILNSSSIVDISHESLMRIWKRLGNWVDEELQSARIYRRLADTAALWEQGKADLYHDPDLHVARTWHDQSKPNALWAETYGGGYALSLRFLEESQKEKAKEEEERESIRQRELSQARELAQERAKSARRMRRFALTLSFLTMLLAVAAMAALFAMRYAREQARLARNAQFTTEEARKTLSNSFSQSDYHFGQTAAEEGRYTESLAYLTRALRNEPNLTAAADRIYSLLTEVSLPVPQFHHHGQRDYECLLFTPDQSKLVTGSDDEFVRVWDLETSQELAAWPHQRDVICLAITQDGRYLASGSEDKTVFVQDLQTFERVSQPLLHESNVTALQFSDNQRWLLSGSWDQGVHVWDWRQGREVLRFLHNGYVNDVQFSPDNRHVLSASRDNTAKVWDLEAGRESLSLQHAQRVNSARYNRAGNLIVTASEDSTAGLWDADSGELLASLPHSDHVREALFSPNGEFIATCSNDRTVRLWSVASGEEIHRWSHRADVDDIDFSPDGEWIASGGDDQTVRLWEVATGRESSVSPLSYRMDVDNVVFSNDGHLLGTIADQEARVWRFEDFREPPREFPAANVTVARLSPNERWVATGSADGEVVQWNRLSSEVRTPPMVHQAGIATLAYDPQGQWLATGDDSGLVKLWSADSGNPLGQPMQHPEPVKWLAFHPSKPILAVICGSTLQYWRVPSAEKAQTHVLESALTNAQFDPVGQYLALCSDRGQVFLGSAHPWTLKHTVTHRSGATHAVFAPNSYFATASEDWTAQIWDIDSGKTHGRSMGHEAEVTCVQFSANGSTFATAGRDQRAILWSVADESRVIGRPLSHQGGVLWVDFSPDSMRVVTASSDHTARVWDVSSTLPLTQPLPHNAPVTYATFTSDGRQILTVAPNDAVRLWNVSLGARGEPVAPIFLQVAQAIGGLRLNATNQLVPINPAERRVILRRAEQLARTSQGALHPNPYERFVLEFMHKHGADLRGAGPRGPGRRGPGFGRRGPGPRPEIMR